MIMLPNKPDLQTLKHNSQKAEKLLKLLANSNRLLILCTLLHAEKTVSELLETIDLSQSALSQHLAKMRQEEILATQKLGNKVIYRIAASEVEAILLTLYQIYCSEDE